MIFKAAFTVNSAKRKKTPFSSLVSERMKNEEKKFGTRVNELSRRVLARVNLRDFLV